MEHQGNNQPLRYLVHSQGWREHLFPYLIRRLDRHDTMMRNPQIQAAGRYDAAGQATAILDLIKWVYREAGEPSPVDVYRAGMWSELMPPKEMAYVQDEDGGNSTVQAPKEERPYRPGGSVA